MLRKILKKFIIIFQFLVIFGIGFTEAKLTEEELNELALKASEDPYKALYVGIHIFKQNPDIAFAIYKQYLARQEGNSPHINSWTAYYKKYSPSYSLHGATLSDLATALPPTHHPNSSLNPQAKAFIPTTTYSHSLYKEDLVPVYVFANGATEQLYIPPFKAGQIKLPDDMAKPTTPGDLKTFGSQPNEGAEMTWILLPDHKLSDFEGNGVIQVDFHFNPRKDKDGKFYNGTHEIGFIPNNPTGWLILKLYKIAFTRLNMFNLKNRVATEPHTPVFSDQFKADKLLMGATG